MPRLDDGSRRARWVVLGLLAGGLAAPWSRADAPAVDDVLRDKGLTRVGQVYLLRNEDDLKDRIAEVRRLSAEYDQTKARLAEDLAALGRTERRYQEVLQRQQALEAEWQAGSKDSGGPPPPPFGMGSALLLRRRVGSALVLKGLPPAAARQGSVRPARIEGVPSPDAARGARPAIRESANRAGALEVKIVQIQSGR